MEDEEELGFQIWSYYGQDDKDNRMIIKRSSDTERRWPDLVCDFAEALNSIGYVIDMDIFEDGVDRIVKGNKGTTVLNTFTVKIDVDDVEATECMQKVSEELEYLRILYSNTLTRNRDDGTLHIVNAIHKIQTGRDLPEGYDAP